MADKTVTKSIANVSPGSYAEVLGAHLNRLASSVIRDPGLRIAGGSGSALAEHQNVLYALVNGTLVTAAAGTDLPALSGTVSNGAFGLFVWTVDSAGTVAQLTLATGASFGAITFPSIPDNKAVVGALLVNPTGTGDFVGGTTNIDDATVAPNAVFFDGTNMVVNNRIKFGDTGLVPSST